MNVLSDVNPIAAFLWLMMAVGIAMFSLNPLLLLLSLLGALLYYFVRNPDAGVKRQLPYLGLFVLSMLLNPLFSHNGATVLLVVNHNPITLEAFIYGAVLGLVLLAVLYWFISFQQIMTSDKLLYVFGSALPKLTLILSIALRYIPMLRQQTKRIRDSQRALGLFKDENVIDRLRGEMRIFSVLVTWALENGIITADSMTARGYGIGRRTRFALYRFRLQDVLLCFACLVLGAVVIYCIASGQMQCKFYPRFIMPDAGAATLAGYIAYAVLALFPGLLELEERIRWKSLKSRI